MNTFNISEKVKVDVVAIVVTYNRKTMLIECINAIINQTMQCDIIVVDNASTDGTKEFFQHSDIIGDRQNQIHYLRLEENTGGAGGFHYGLKYAIEHDWDRFWLMDDDAKPEPDALKNLLSSAGQNNTIYGSVAVGIKNGKKLLCWPAGIINRKKGNFTEDYDSLNEIEEVTGIPFIGFLIHRSLVGRIGLPNRNFFIYSDDQEYCERAKKNGAKLIIIKNSMINHPLPMDGIIFRFQNIKIVYRSLPLWKIYYYVRNKIIIGRKYYGFRLWSQTIPGIIFRFFVRMIKEKKRTTVCYTYIIAFLDGFSNNTERKLTISYNKEKE